jgi:hypothetical protein
MPDPKKKKLNMKDVMQIPREELRTYKEADDFDVEDLTMGLDARISIYTAPIPGHHYVAGGDFALGVEGRDYDALVLLDKNTWPVEQVAELHGRWGPDRFDRLIYCMARYYYNAFIVGERQVGLPVLRSLLNNFEYGYLYYNRNEATRGRRRQDILGHHKIPGDPCIPRLRAAVRGNQLIPRSEQFHGELKNYQFRPRGKEKEKTEDMRDSDLIMGAPSGEFDDLVNAGAYAWKGIEEVHLFEADRPIFAQGTAGSELGMATALELENKKAQPRPAFRHYSKGKR